MINLEVPMFVTAWPEVFYLGELFSVFSHLCFNCIILSVLSVSLDMKKISNFKDLKCHVVTNCIYCWDVTCTSYNINCVLSGKSGKIVTLSFHHLLGLCQ